MCEQDGRDPDEMCIGEGAATGTIWLGWQAFETKARKVFEGTREPTTTMVGAGHQAQDFNDGIDTIWSAMIDAALAE